MAAVAARTAVGVAAFDLTGLRFGYVSGEHPAPNPGGAFRFLVTAAPFVSVALAVLIGGFYPRDLPAAPACSFANQCGDR